MQLAQLYTRYLLAAHDTALWTPPDARLHVMPHALQRHTIQPNGRQNGEQLSQSNSQTNSQHNPRLSADVANANPELPTASSHYKMAAVLVLLAQGPQGIEILLTRRAATLRQHAHQISFPGGRLDAGEAAADAALRETWEEVGIAPAQVKLWGPLPWQQSQTGYLVQPWLGQLQSGPAQLHSADDDHLAVNSVGSKGAGVNAVGNSGVDVNRPEVACSDLQRMNTYQARNLASNKSCNIVMNQANKSIWPTLQLNPSEVSSAFGLPLQHLQAPEHWHQWQIPNVQLPQRLPWQRQTGPRTLYFLPYEQHLIWGLTAGILQSLRRLCLPQ